MEEIKVTREIYTTAIFVFGNAKTGSYQNVMRKKVENKDLQNLNIDPHVVYFYFGDDYVLTDEEGKTYVSTNQNVYDFMTPHIYCGRAVSTAEALTMFAPGTWQYDTIKECQRNKIDKVAITTEGFVEGITRDSLTLEEYVAKDKNNPKRKVLHK